MLEIETTLSISEARKQLFTLAREVQKNGKYYTLTERGIPTTVLLSARFFESLQQSYEKNGPRQGSALPAFSYATIQAPFLVRETSAHAYHAGGDAYKEKDLLRSQLYVTLTEHYGYPFNSIEIGRWIRKPGNGSQTFIENDLLVDERDGGTLLICAVENAREYERHQDEIVAKLFEIAAAFAHQTHQSRYLVYATRVSAQEIQKRTSTTARDRWLVIDAQKYPGLEEWRAAGCPVEKELPKHASLQG